MNFGMCSSQEVAVKELLTVSGRPTSLRKTTSVPNINQVGIHLQHRALYQPAFG